MEEFTSQDLESQDLESQDPESLDQLEENTTEYQYQEDLETGQEVNLFTSGQEGEALVQSLQMQEGELLTEVRQIKDLLRESSVETTTEVTTDYVQMIYSEVKHQNENLNALQGSVLTIGKDQQTIGVLSVGATILLVGALGVFFFLWRVR